MRFPATLRVRFGRTKHVTPVVAGPTRSAPPPPPPPAATTLAPTSTPLREAAAPRARPAMRLMMADGTLQDLPYDPEVEARAEYLIKSMLPPPPPPPASQT